ncbi:MAG: hypothetical protein IJO05_07450 [Oscillospiraceae bacterium]|nr:hypothetical protein [Oscillospiraceae bacterium]
MDNTELSGLELLKLLSSLSDNDDDDIPFAEENETGKEKQKEEQSDTSALPKKVSMKIVSVKEAREKFGQHIAMGDTTYGNKLADYIVDPDNHVTGEPHHFHNLISCYMEIGDYYNAHRVTQMGMRQYPRNIDLLANAIRVASCGIDFKTTEQYLQVALQIDKKYWNWRLFLFSIEAYRYMMSQCPIEQMDEYYQKALDLAKDYQKYIQADERAYNQEAEIYLMANDIGKARAVLTQAIEDGYWDPDAKRYMPLVAPQCCVTLIDSILEDTHEYAEIVKIAKRGIQFTAQEQPSANMGYFVYRWAMALDALAIQGGYKVPDDIKNALKVYQVAYELNKGRSYAKTIKTRYFILSRNQLNPIYDMPLEQKLDENKDSES